MAYVGLSFPVVAKRTESAQGSVSYSNGFICGKAIGIDISPNEATGDLYADNQLAEHDRQFTYADITLRTSTLPIECESVIFSHTVVSDSGDDPTTITDKSTDNVNEVGLGIMRHEIVSGSASYVAMWMPRVKISPASESYTTKGDSIEFSTPSLEGKAYAGSNRVWRERAVFTDEDDAIAWLKTKAGIN